AVRAARTDRHVREPVRLGAAVLREAVVHRVRPGAGAREDDLGEGETGGLVPFAVRVSPGPMPSSGGPRPAVAHPPASALAGTARAASVSANRSFLIAPSQGFIRARPAGG